MTKGMVDAALDATGATYRELNYWTSLGLLHVRVHGRRGSGGRHEWEEPELRIAAMIVRLRAVGLDLRVAAGIARAHELVEGAGLGITEHDLGSTGITLALRTKGVPDAGL